MVVDETNEARRWRAVAIALALLVLVAFVSVHQGVSRAETQRPPAAEGPAACDHQVGPAAEAGPPAMPVGAVSL